MLKKLQQSKPLFLISAIFLTILFLSGCTQEKKSITQSSVAFDDEYTIQTSSGPVELLRVNDSKLPSSGSANVNNLFKTTEMDSSLFYVEKLIHNDRDENLVLVSPEYGISAIEFHAGDIFSDMTMVLEWAEDDIFQAEIYSKETGDDIDFKNPVEVHFSLENADWMNVNLNNVKLCKYDFVSDSWQQLSSTVTEKSVEASIPGCGLYQIYEINTDGTMNDVCRLSADTYYDRKYIFAERGGTIRLGDRVSGKSKIQFKKDDLKENTLIEFKWAAGGTVSGMFSDLEFGPHGTYFNNPVKVELSYKMADLSSVNEDELSIYYYNEDADVWELIGGKVDTRRKKVIGWLNHFSRYALAPTP